MLSWFLRLRLLLSRLVLPLLLSLVLSLLVLEARGCLDEETKLVKLKKLINKKIKLDINEKYRSEKECTNEYISFLYIHELTASDYVEYVLNKSEDYDCVLFVIDVESTNGASMFDRKNLILLELFNRVAREFILGNFSLYSEGESITEERTTRIGASGSDERTTPIGARGSEERTTPIGASGSEERTTPIGASGSEERTTPIGAFGSEERTTPIGAFGSEKRATPIGAFGSEKRATPPSTPIFFFYINIHKPSILPLKYIHAIDEVPEFFYVGKETFLHFDSYSKVRPKYMFEEYLKVKRLSERDKGEMSNKLVEAYFSDFIQAHNRGGSGGDSSWSGGGDSSWSGGDDSSWSGGGGDEGVGAAVEGSNYLGKIQKHIVTTVLVVLFSLLYILLKMLQRWPSLMFVCSYVLFLTCLSGIFHCLINKSELYNTAKNLDSVLHKYIYRSTSAQYVYEGVAFSLFIFLITFALFLLCRYSTYTFMPRGPRNLWLMLLLLLAYASLDVIHEINLYKMYYSTYFFFPPTKFFH
ncbi:hypothetical protein PCYB_021640, partial [Plasmodium cynomolgi strain B]